MSQVFDLMRPGPRRRRDGLEVGQGFVAGPANHIVAGAPPDRDAPAVILFPGMAPRLIENQYGNVRQMLDFTAKAAARAAGKLK
jgi:hypothetical protein